MIEDLAVGKRALELARGLEPSPKNLGRVAVEVGDDLARWAFTQWALRERAASKFVRASEMLFTREALEQATHERVAAYRSSRFPQGERFVDLTCGIGADLIAFAGRGAALGVDLDPERAAYARHNLAVHGYSAEVLVADANEFQFDADYAFADPARRTGGERTFDPNRFSPNPLQIAERFRHLKQAAIKLSPMMLDDDLESLGSVEFWSFGGECREAVVWLGSDVKSADPVAIRVETGESLPSGPPPSTTDEADGFLYEADPAAIRAHALDALCERFNFKGLLDSNGYLTGDKAIESSWLKGYRTLWFGKGDVQETRKRLRALGSRAPVVKSRAKGVDVQRLGKAWNLDGDRTLIVVVCASGKSLRHVICEPLAPSGEAPA